MNGSTQRISIIGDGFAALTVARALRWRLATAEITLIADEAIQAVQWELDTNWLAERGIQRPLPR